jgi:spore germination protein
MRAFKRAMVPVLCVILLGQSGCWSQKLFEDIGFILQMGLESAPDNKIQLSVTSPVVETGVKEKVDFEYTTVETLIRSSRQKIRNVSGKMLQGGKIQHLYFSRELAEKGIHEYMEIFLRDPENPLLANIMVVDGSPREMMETSLQFKDKARPGVYVAKLIEDAHNRFAAPEARIFNYTIWYYSGTIDPITTFIQYDGRNIRMAGTALFSGDKMVGTINVDQTMLLNALRGKCRQFEYVYRGMVPGEDQEDLKKGAVLNIIHPKCRFEIDTGGNKPAIKVNFKGEAALDEDAGPHGIEKEEVQKDLEKILEESMEKDILALLKHLQEVGSDPIGFGEILRAKQNAYWKSANWKEKYKTAEFTVEVKVNLNTYGTIS